MPASCWHCKASRLRVVNIEEEELWLVLTRHLGNVLSFRGDLKVATRWQIRVCSGSITR
ncbi:hypothetical protein OESDEN_10993 [Oesophagostomum dentatum]|uniref:Uncharacterized protein n=1 Tax=Oesophagostomum dentatum TaxID=61180 RepID=A0A0B1T1C6_OESDE|nr:hypothetical protein OESDEN_10993 [Oesophagostomum dentatum]